MNVMKSTSRLLRSRSARLAAALSWLSLSTAGAAPVPEFSADIRWRPESDRVLFTQPQSIFGERRVIEGVHNLRTRISARFTASANAEVFAQIQDSRLLGTPPSGSLDRDDNLGLHQGYLRIHGRVGVDAEGQAGRFAVAHGNQRILGSVGWSNTGRAFDGVRLSAVVADTRVSLAYLKLTERAADTGNDADLYVIDIGVPNTATSLLALIDYDSQPVVRIDGTGSDPARARATLAAYSAASSDGGYDYIANLAYQLGEEGELSRRAALATLELGVMLGPHRIGAGADFATGDDPDTETIESFDNPYYTGHKFRGNMDQFVGSNREGLLDLYVTNTLAIAPGWKMANTAHMFRTAESYVASTGEASHDVGVELDLVATCSSMDGVSIVAGASLLLPSDAWRGDEGDAEAWGFLQVTVATP